MVKRIGVARKCLRRIVIAAVLCGTTTAAFADLPVLRFRDMYTRGVEYSERTEDLEGERIIINGFMAPPLKPDARFFILTKMPMAVCPFCETEADWPDDIVYVAIEEELVPIRFNTMLEVEGTLSLGVEIDEKSGFVSLVRLENAEYRVR